MPVTVEVKHEYFNTWAGRIKIIEVVSTYFQFVIQSSFYGFTLVQTLDLVLKSLDYLGCIFRYRGSKMQFEILSSHELA